MAIWSIDDNRIDSALAEVRHRVPSVDDRGELFARAVWSVVIEPGDSIAGALIAAVGPEHAAELLICRAPARSLVDATEGEITAQQATDALLRWMPRLRSADVLRSLESAALCGARMITPRDTHWPTSFDALGFSPPVLLWARGDASLMRQPSVAVVGARAATGYGEHVAMEFSAGLVARGAVVVSGGAYGIDGMAHRAALASGGGTIAVLAGGVDRLYPSGHEALLTRIADQGLLVSEVPCGSAPTKWRFLQRNRLIAALADATVVIEAGHRSGALNTINHALRMGRPVGAVPGPITSAASAGCHRVIREDTVECVTSVPEIMQLAFGSDGVLDAHGAADLSISGLTGSGHTGDSREPTVTATVEDPMHVRVLDALRPRRGQATSELARAVGEGEGSIRAALGTLSIDNRALCGDDGLWRRPERRSQSDGDE